MLLELNAFGTIVLLHIAWFFKVIVKLGNYGFRKILRLGNETSIYAFKSGLVMHVTG